MARWNIFCLFILYFLYCPCLINSQLHFISISPDRGSGVGSRVMIPLFDAMVLHLQATYPRIKNISFTPFIRSGVVPCTEMEYGLILDSMVDLYEQGKLERSGLTVIAPAAACSDVIYHAGDFARELDVLTFSCSINDRSLTDKVRFPTVVSAGPVDLRLFGSTLAKTLDYFQWHTVVFMIDTMASDVPNAMRSNQTCRYPITALRKSDISSRIIKLDSDNHTAWRTAIENATTFSRIIVVCSTTTRQKEFLKTASDMGYANGDYVFILPYSFVVPDDLPFECDPSGNGNHSCAPGVIKALQTTLILQPSSANRADVANTSDSADDPLPPWHSISHVMKNNDFAHSCWDTLPNIAKTYDAHYEDLASTERISGRLFRSYFASSTFDTNLKSVSYYDGLRISEIHITQFDSMRRRFRAILTMNNRNETLMPTDVVPVWPGGTLPLDRPECGFRGDLCVSKVLINVLAGLAAGLLSLAVATIACVIRHYSRSDGNPWWIVYSTELTFCKFDTNLPTQKRFSLRPKQPVIRKMSLSLNSQDRSSERIAKLRNVYCWVTWLKYDYNGKFSRSVMRLMSTVHGLHHSNLNPFIGLCMANSKLLYVLEEFIPRGSLADLVQSQKSDGDLILSLTVDLVQGLHYLHASSWRFHGNLKSTKCLLNKWFTLRIGDFVSDKLRSLLQPSDSPSATAVLWTAPEILRAAKPTNSTSDVFSLAIILHEILYQLGPFGLGPFCKISQTAAEETVAKIKASGNDPYRPSIPQNTPGFSHAHYLVQLMQDCWQEHEDLRPTMREVKQRISNLLNEKRVHSTSLIDRVMRRMEAYQSQLESVVIDRTMEYQMEKRKCDLLLLQIYPKPIFENLRAGVLVKPESYDSATVLFTTVIGYEALLATASLTEFINLLDRVYSGFDTALQPYDAYKMETTGASYMVVSGIPDRNGCKHCEEVCRVALQFRQLFRQNRYHDQIQLRSGMDTGPVAAGIVGLKRPRYCLFGNTVNCASRMESYGIADTVHMSDTAAHLANAAGLAVSYRGAIVVKGKGVMDTYFLE